jgi:hypothetical protein
MVKSTYGTGCFALMNTGAKPVASANRMLTTIAYRLNGETTYALEGSIFIAGAAVQWLRDGLGLIENAADSQALAEQADPNQDVYLVPAFVGLGAPYWDADARGAMFGLTRNTGPKEIARSVLQSVGYQTSDLISAMQSDWPDAHSPVLRVDGGMTASDWTMQFLSDILGAPVDRRPLLRPQHSAPPGSREVGPGSGLDKKNSPPNGNWKNGLNPILTRTGGSSFWPVGKTRSEERAPVWTRQTIKAPALPGLFCSNAFPTYRIWLSFEPWHPVSCGLKFYS